MKTRFLLSILLFAFAITGSGPVLARQQADELFAFGRRGFVRNNHLLRELRGLAQTQFANRVHARCKQQFGVVVADAFDAHEVGLVGQTEDFGGGNLHQIGEGLASPRCFCLFEIARGRPDPEGTQLLRADRINPGHFTDGIG